MARKQVANDQVLIKARVSERALIEANINNEFLSTAEIIRGALSAYPKYKRLRRKYKQLKAASVATNNSQQGGRIKVADIQAQEAQGKFNSVGARSCRNGCPKFKRGVCEAIAVNGESGYCIYDRGVNKHTIGEPSDDEKEQIAEYLDSDFD